MHFQVNELFGPRRREGITDSRRLSYSLVNGPVTATRSLSALAHGSSDNHKLGPKNSVPINIGCSPNGYKKYCGKVKVSRRKSAYVFRFNFLSP